MIEDFAAPLAMLHQKKQSQRITAIGIKAARKHIKTQKAILTALRKSDKPALKSLISDVEWKLQEYEQQLGGFINQQEDNALWIEWLDLALRLTKGD